MGLRWSGQERPEVGDFFYDEKKNGERRPAVYSPRVSRAESQTIEEEATGAVRCSCRSRAGGCDGSGAEAEMKVERNLYNMTGAGAQVGASEVAREISISAWSHIARGLCR